MKLLSLFAASASLLSIASARISGVAVPDTIKPGDGFNAIIVTEDYIQSVYDVAIAFGLLPKPGYPGSLGSVIGSFYLGPEQSNTRNNVTKWVTVPAGIPTGPSYFTAAAMSLYGAGATPTIDNFNVSVTVGDSTSTNYVVAYRF